MTDLVKQLRERTVYTGSANGAPVFEPDALCQAAADEIEALRAEVKRLTARRAEWLQSLEPTPRALEAFKAIDWCITETGQAPTFTEIGALIGDASVGNVAQLVAQLEERGFISRLKFIPRSIKILKLPKGYVRRSPQIKEAS